MPKIALIMGSDSDFPTLVPCIKLIRSFGIECDVRVISAHRTPQIAEEFARNAESNSIELIIAAAGKAAHLPGVLAAYTPLPVIGVPIKSSTLDGMDALFSIVQMPKGIPVATVAINGSDNAALLAVQILSVKYPDLRRKMVSYKEEMKNSVIAKDNKIQMEIEKI